MTDPEGLVHFHYSSGTKSISFKDLEIFQKKVIKYGIFQKYIYIFLPFQRRTKIIELQTGDLWVMHKPTEIYESFV